MDLVYIPEVLTFGSFRSPQYRDYEQPWNRNYFENGKSASYQHHRQQQQPPQTHDSCHLCKEKKRRSLAAYIRGKTRNNSCSEICEEEEEEVAAAEMKAEAEQNPATASKPEPKSNKSSA